MASKRTNPIHNQSAEEVDDFLPPVETPEPEEVHASPFQPKGNPLYVDSDLDPFDSLVFMRKAVPLKQLGTAPMMVKDIFFHGVIIDREGVPTPTDRVIMVTAEDTAYGSVSRGVVGGANQIIAVLGRRHFSPPLKMRVEEVDLGGGRRTYNLIPER